ncbi:MAG: cytochrome c biogenesis protein CcsA [Actinomycetota bacterium]|nr:cytochrome c biogenesis protein CcsA [Actinomycetota bacterium]
MASVGRALLILGLVVAVYGLAASLHGARTGQRAWIDSGRRSMYAIAGLMTFAFGIIEVAFLRSDFAYTIVSGASSTTTPTFYKAAAVWSTQQGSLLLWVWLLSMWSSLALLLTRHRVRELVPYATAILLGFCTFFLTLANLFANPFSTTGTPPADGSGLDPLLRHTTMMIHPPMVYTGYTMLTIPFAFAVAALLTGRLNAEWIQVTRRFALAAWLCLGIGVLLGARWSYTELGWGGYWAWDPVENAALMPWLLSTAFLHSIMIQEKRGMLKVWNVSLILATGTMAIIGTFLVRSGILSSIHAFVSDPTLNISFVALIAVMVIASVGLVIHRRAELRTESRLESLWSREAVFLVQNLVLVALTAVIFWLTFFPLISEAVTGTTQSIGPPAFRPFVVPLALILVLLSGVGPIIAWRRVTVANLRRSFAFPAGVALVTLVLLLTVAHGVGPHIFALLMFCFAAFALGAVAQELWRGVGARRAMTHEAAPIALFSLVRRNRRRYGGYTVHAGLAVLLIGVAASSSFQHSRYARMTPGQSANIDGYSIRYVRPTATPSAQKISLGAVLDVSKNGHHVTTLHTSYGLYPSQDPSLGVVGRFFNSGSNESRIGLSAGLTHDIWTVVDPPLTPLQGLIKEGDRKFASLMTAVSRLPASQQQAELGTVFTLRDRLVAELTQRFITHPWPATFLLIVSPLVTWLWFGGIIVAFGGLIALWPIPVLARRRVRSAAYAARLARELA